MDLELQVIGTVAGHKISFLIATGAAFSLLTSFKGPLQSSEVGIEEVSGILFYPQITPPLPMALMGRDLLAKLQTSINLPFLDPTSTLCIQMAPEPLASPHSQNLPPDLPLIDPQVWDTETPLVA